MAGQAFGVIGLEVMGRNIAQNIERNGFPVAVFNRTWSKTEDFMNGPGRRARTSRPPRRSKSSSSCSRSPRRILMMVKAGGPTDATIQSIKPFLEPGDILIDGGNALYTDTERRERGAAGRPASSSSAWASPAARKGAAGARASCPAATRTATSTSSRSSTKIAAKAPSDGAPCVTYCGGGGAGHFVKMVHNGIEYGDMQLIAEAYDLLKNVARAEQRADHGRLRGVEQGRSCRAS